MAFQFLPILGAISNLATSAWDTYNKSKRVQQSLAVEKEQKAAHSALVKRVEAIESSSLEQARLLSELSKDVERFAQEVQQQLLDQQAHVQRQQRLLTAALIASSIAVLVCVVIFFRSHG